jgi:hypothetical protein
VQGKIAKALTGLGVDRMDTVRATERLLERYAEMSFARVDAWVDGAA